MQGSSKNVLFSGSSPFMALFSISAIVMLVMFHFGSSLNQEGYMSALIPSSIRSSSLPLEPSIQKLVDALKESVETVVKNTGLKSSTDTLNILHWKTQNSCKSRTELVSWYNHRLHSPNSRSSLTLAGGHAKWKLVLEEYANLHSLCIRAAGNLSEYFFARNTSSGCKFVIAEAKTGMGNKVLLMTSAVVYAILTQRVILIPTSTSIPGIMCEPFLGSTWALSDDLQARSVSLWTETKDLLDTLDTAKAGGYTGPPAYAARVDDNWQPVSRFFCSMEQAYLTQVTWLSVMGSLYFLPKLFAIPSYRATMEALFPDPSLALTHMLRTFMLPSDEVWAQVKIREKQYLNNMHIQVGIQARYFSNQEETQRILNSNVVGCILENRMLQEALFIRRTPQYSATSTPFQATLFVASLTTVLHNHLWKTYIRNASSNDTSIQLMQLSNEGMQRDGPKEVYSRALLEVIHLSLSQTLLITPRSTFGGLAQAYGALRPWFIETREDAIMPCVRAQTVDVCYQIPDVDYKCPYEHGINMKHIMDFIPYIKFCLDADVGRSGIQLVSLPQQPHL